MKGNFKYEQWMSKSLNIKNNLRYLLLPSTQVWIWKVPHFHLSNKCSGGHFHTNHFTSAYFLQNCCGRFQVNLSELWELPKLAVILTTSVVTWTKFIFKFQIWVHRSGNHFFITDYTFTFFIYFLKKYWWSCLSSSHFVLCTF